MSTSHPHTNRLSASTSPYLLQHQHNPVDWYPWGEEAIRKAREEDRPIFLSIGYAACHWCHVMERESFENESVAALLNREFVSIKVDREERPDLDEIYMTATQLMTHSGGWPMSVFLTPDLKPFFAGTYFPPEDRWGRPGFKSLVVELGRLWRDERAKVLEQAERVTAAIEEITSRAEGQGAVSPALVRNAVAQMARDFDAVNGGFGSSPKFPPSMRLELFLNRSREDAGPELLQMARTTLDRMARGGMYDQVGGGFHRYSVDERWLVPHFEKMLYDNALLARVYTLAYERTGYWYYRRVALEIFDYVIREMTHPEGGIYSTTDADSEGEEGKFFVWTPAQVVAVLGQEEGEFFNRLYDVSARGNWEGHSIPNLLPRSLDEWAGELATSPEDLDARLAPMRRHLWEAREQRVHPLLDDKILSGWNGLMIRAFAEGYRVFGDQRCRDAAEGAADFVLTRMRAEEVDGAPLLRSFREGQAHLNAYQEDYAYLALALLELYPVTGNERWKQEGLALLDQMNERFWDEETGSYFYTSHDHEALITRTRSLQDGATPSGNSAAALALIRAAQLTGEPGYRLQAARILSLGAPQMSQLPAAVPNLLVAADEYLRAWPEGIRVPGADAVKVEGFLSRTSVRPGERFWVGIRLAIQEGYHLNSSRPRQDYLVPTAILVDPSSGFTVARESFPPAAEYTVVGQDEPLSVFSGTVLLGAELEAPAGIEVGTYPVQVTLRMQPCDDQQCYPPLEARLRFTVPITQSEGNEQHADVFTAIRKQAESA